MAHLERELEFSALVESGDLPIATRTYTQTRQGGNLVSSGIDPTVSCTFCNEDGHVYKGCPKLKAKKDREATEGKKEKPTYPKCPACAKTNDPEERRWKGAGAHLQPKRTKTEDET